MAVRLLSIGLKAWAKTKLINGVVQPSSIFNYNNKLEDISVRYSHTYPQEKNLSILFYILKSIGYKFSLIFFH